MRDLLTAVKNERLYPIIYVTALYGLRRSEVLGLKWDSINFAMQTLTIRHTVARVTKVVEKNKTKNASSFRSFPLTDDAVRLFKILQMCIRDSCRRGCHPDCTCASCSRPRCKSAGQR